MNRKVNNMPRVKPLTTDHEVDYQWSRISEKLIADIAVSGIKKIDLAKISGVTPGAISQQLKSKRITMQTYIAWQILKGEGR